MGLAEWGLGWVQLLLYCLSCSAVTPFCNHTTSLVGHEGQMEGLPTEGQFFFASTLHTSRRSKVKDFLLAKEECLEPKCMQRQSQDCAITASFSAFWRFKLLVGESRNNHHHDGGQQLWAMP